MYPCGLNDGRTDDGTVKFIKIDFTHICRNIFNLKFDFLTLKKLKLHKNSS